MIDGLLAAISRLQAGLDEAVEAFSAGRFEVAAARTDAVLAAADAAVSPIDRDHVRLSALTVRARACLHLDDAARAQAALDALIEAVAASGDPQFALWVRVIELESALFTGRPPATLQAHADALWRETCGVRVDAAATTEVAGAVLAACCRLLDVAGADLQAVEARAAAVAPFCPPASREEFERLLFERHLHSPTPQRGAPCVARLRALAPCADDPQRLEHGCDLMAARLAARLGRADEAFIHVLRAWRRLPGFVHDREVVASSGLLLLDLGLDRLGDGEWAEVEAVVRAHASGPVLAELEGLSRQRGAGSEPWWDPDAPPVRSLAELLRWLRRGAVPPMWLFEQAEGLVRDGAGRADLHEASLLALLRGASLRALAPEDPEVAVQLDHAMETARFAEVWFAAARELLALRRAAGRPGDRPSLLASVALRGLHELRALRDDPGERREILRRYRQILNHALAEHLDGLERGDSSAGLALLDTLELARCHFCDELLTDSDGLGPRFRPESVETYQQALPADTAALCAFRVDETALVAVITRHGVLVRTARLGDAEWSEVSRRLLRGLRGSRSWTPELLRRASDTSSALGIDAVLRDARERWGALRHLFVVRDERLDEIPFAALVVDEEPLGDAVGLSFHPCLRDAVSSAAPIRGRRGPLVAFFPEIDRDGRPQHPDTPSSRGFLHELHALAEHGAAISAGSSCTLARIHHAAGAAVLHVGGHNDGPRRDERIRLGAGEPLTAAFVRGLALARVELVVLNACDSACEHLGDRADAWEGLTASFRIAGARTVISSRMRASAEHSALFAHHLYARLREADAVTALRGAQRAMAAGSAGACSVGHWATYELHGAPFVRVYPDGG